MVLLFCVTFLNSVLFSSIIKILGSMKLKHNAIIMVGRKPIIGIIASNVHISHI